MVSISIAFLILALVFFVLAASGLPLGRINAMAIGLVFLTLWHLAPALTR